MAAAAARHAAEPPPGPRWPGRGGRATGAAGGPGGRGGFGGGGSQVGTGTGWDGGSGAQGAVRERRPVVHGETGSSTVPCRAATTAPPGAPDALAAAQGRPPVAAGRGAETSSSSGWPRERRVYGRAGGRSQCRRTGAGASASTALPSAGTHGPGASTGGGTVPRGIAGGCSGRILLLSPTRSGSADGSVPACPGTGRVPSEPLIRSSR